MKYTHIIKYILICVTPALGRKNKQWRRDYMSSYVELRDKYLKGRADGSFRGLMLD